MLNVVRIIARLNVGGPARHVVWLTDGLDEERFNTTLIAGRVPEGEEDMVYFAEEHGVEPWFVKEMSRELSFSDLKALWKIWRKLVQEEPDVVHTHTAKAGTLGRFAAFLYRWLTPSILLGAPRKVRVFHTFHGHIFHNYYGSLKTKVFLWIEKVLARLATEKIIVITEQQRHEIHDQFGVGKDGQFEVIRLGLDLDKLRIDQSKRDQFREQLGVAPDVTVVGIVGRLTAIKNHHLFLDAIRNFRESSDNNDVRFVIIGDGDMRSDLENYAVDCQVNFIGNRNDPDVFYSGLDVVVLTSKNEGTPLSLIEAMSFGLPWISTEVGGVVDLAGARSSETDVQGPETGLGSGGVRIHERGLLVDSNDTDSLKEALVLLVSDKDLRERVSRAGAPWVRENYSKERLIRDIERLYSS